MMRATLLIWILSAMVCMGRGHHHVGPVQEDRNATDQQQQTTGPDNRAISFSMVTSANKDFTFRLYQKLAAATGSQGKNIFFSPTSVSMALAALSVGARGETHQQLFSGLGYNESLLTQSDVDQAYKMLLTRADRMSNEDTSEGTAVFVDNKFKPHPEFLEVLKQSYFADGFTVDFTKSTESEKTINKYVKEKTNGKIDKLVENLDPSTIMYLISYIFFKGKWEFPFDPALTKEDIFHVDENTEVPVQMMNQESRFDSYYDQEISTSVLHLPLNNTNSMLLLLPDNSRMLGNLERVICPSHVTRWLRWMKSRTYDVYVPKLSIKTSYNLKDVLIAMGMTDMFGDQANLTGISEGQKLAVSEVVHQATLDVDEVGITAAAATGIGITFTSFMPATVLKFNRPFMILITDRPADNILFMGKIVNPNM